MSEEQFSRVVGLYTPPFEYKYGYVRDVQGNTLADTNDDACLLRIRGWGRISYMDEPEKLQDAVGERIADLLSKHWSDPSTVGN